MFSLGSLVDVAVLNQGVVRPELANLLIHMTHSRLHRVHITYPNAQPISHNRNQVALDFLKGESDFLLMIDSDIVPHGNPLNLLRHNVDVVGAACPQWHEGDLYWVAMDRVVGGYVPVAPELRHGLAAVDAVGTGCILIARRVLERLFAPFDCRFSGVGLLELGEDFSFCEKVKELGFRVWVDWELPCSHHKTVDLLEVLSLLGKGDGNE